MERWPGLPWNTGPTSRGILARHAVESAIAYNLRFPGQYYQSETGLFQNYFRDYDPQTGRYLEADPIGLGGLSYSTFAYVEGNPISFYDPTGLCPADAVKALICLYRDWHNKKLGEKVAELQAEGYLVVTSVSLRLVSNTDLESYAVADYIATIPNSGIYRVGEVKTGNAGLTPRQAENYANGYIQIIGNKAIPLGLYPNDVVPGTYLGVDRYPGCPF